MLATKCTRARDVSDAWIQSVELISNSRGREAFHHVVTIEQPSTDDQRVREIVNDILIRSRLQSVETVRNTIFPAELAAKRKPRQLIEMYRRLYPKLRRFPKNRDGTYFGRMVLPLSGDASVKGQLSIVLDKLARKGDRHFKAIYEMDLSDGGELQIHARGKDQRYGLRGFPCLSYCSFQRDDNTLHMVAHYRNQYMLERAYGNYLGLGQLLDYVARHSSLATGALTVIAGHALIEGSVRLVRQAVTAAALVYRNSGFASA